MSKNIVLEELLAIPPFSSYRILYGFNKELQINHVASGLGELHSKSLFVIDTNSYVLEEVYSMIEYAIDSSVSAIMLLGDCKGFLINESIAKIPPNEILIFNLSKQSQFAGALEKVAEQVSIEEVEKAVILIGALKEMGLFLDFIKTSTQQIATEMNEIGMEAYLTQFQNKSRHQLYMTNEWFELLFASDAHQDQLKDLRDIMHAYYQLEEDTSQPYVEIEYNEGKFACTIYKLRTKQKLYGFFILKQKIALISEIDRVQLQCLSPLLLAGILKQKEIQTAESKYQQNFVYDLLHNNFDSEYAMIQQAKNWQWDLTRPHHLLIFDLRYHLGESYDQSKMEHAISLIRNAFNMLFFHPIIMEMDDKIVVIFASEPDKLSPEVVSVRQVAEQVYQSISKKILWADIYIGIGRLYQSIRDVFRSFQEAKMTLSLGEMIFEKNTITHFDDLGVVRLLSSLRFEQLEDYYKDYLRELYIYDGQNQTNLMETLQIFIHENGNLNTTAEKLFIHSNTLRNHLKKIENVLDVDLQQFEDIVNLSIAFKINTMITK